MAVVDWLYGKQSPVAICTRVLLTEVGTLEFANFMSWVSRLVQWLSTTSHQINPEASYPVPTVVDKAFDGEKCVYSAATPVISDFNQSKLHIQ